MNAFTQVQHVAQNSVGEVWSFILSFLAFIVISILLFLFGVRTGKGSLVTLTMSIYAGFAFFSVFPFQVQLIKMFGSGWGTFIVNIGIFAVFTIIAHIAIARHISNDFFSSNKLVLLGISILTSGLILVILYHTLNAKSVYAFTPAIDQLFAPNNYFFWWFVAPLVGCLFLAR